MNTITSKIRNLIGGRSVLAAAACGWLVLGTVSRLQGAEAPYGGTPWSLPGTVQAENFDTGGNNVAYFTTDNINHGGQYRTSEGVSIEATTDTGGGYNVGWTAVGEWLNYTVNVGSNGYYFFSVRVADSHSGGAFHISVDGGNATGAMSMPNTGGNQNWTTVNSGTVSLAAGQHIVQIRMDAADSYGTVGNYNWWSLTVAPVAVTVSPTSATATTGTTQQFSATVTGTSNTAVSWSVNNVAGGNSTVGTISTGGLYTAPSAVPSPATVTVKATSAADSTKSASATVNVVVPPPIAVTVSPTSATVATGATQQFSATVTGTTNTAVSWTVNNVAGGNSTVGTINTGGLYTAPSAVPNPATVTVKATSAADSTKSASATVNLVVVIYTTDNIQVDPTNVLSDVTRNPLGINVDWEDDDQYWRTSPAVSLATGLTNLGVRYLRYPGGEEANLFLWSVPPYTASVPTLSLPGPNQSWYARTVFVANYTTPIYPYGFDEFMADCQTTGCTPIIVVTLRPYLNTASPNNPVPSRQTLIDTAAAWVHYANIVKGYGIKQWEIGNEWIVDNPGYTGPAESRSQYILDVRDFSLAMKAVDPTIQIGAFAYAQSDFQAILQADAPYIDFLIVHMYPFGLGGQTPYSSYQTMTNLWGVSNALLPAIQAIAEPGVSPADRARLKISVTEMNAMFSDINTNNLGDAIGLLDSYGQTMSLFPQVDHMEVWTDHWLQEPQSPAATGWTMLDNSNGVTAKGMALTIWGDFLLQQMVMANNVSPTPSSPDPMVRSFATYNQNDGNLNVVLLNKDTVIHTAVVTLQNYNVLSNSSANQWILSGTGPSDPAPTFLEGPAVPVSSGTLSVNLPGPSVVVLTLQGANTKGLNLIADAGFEGANLSPWALSGNPQPSLTPVVHTGMQAVKIPPGAGVTQSVSVANAQGKTCTLSAWGTLNAAASSGAAQFGVSGTLNGQPWSQAVTFTATGYTLTLQSQTFTMPTGLLNPVVWASNSTGSTLTLDDLVLSAP